MVFTNGFSIDEMSLENKNIATEGILKDFIDNVFSFGKIDKKYEEEEISKFKDIIAASDNLFGKMPEASPYLYSMSYVKINNEEGFISIHNINFELLFKHIYDTYGEKKLDKIFYRTYKSSDIKRFKNKKISRSQMRITSLMSPIFFALELCILFTQLYKKYKVRVYKTIVTLIYDGTWLKKSDEISYSPPDLSYAQKLLNPKYQLKKHQIDFINSYPKWKARLNLRGVYLAFDQGLGKTLTALSLAMSLHIDKIYIICPNTLVSNWINEINSYYDGRIKSFDCKGKSKPSNNTKVFIINNESIKNMFPYIDNSCKSMMIVDEGHNFRNLKSTRVKELVSFMEKLNPSDVLPMSGTPLKASPNELVPAFLLLDPTFSPVAAEMYDKCFNFNNYEAMEIVTSRLGKMIYRKMKSDVLTLPNKFVNDMSVKILDPEPYLMLSVKRAVNEQCAIIAPEVLKENVHILNDFESMVKKYSTAGTMKTNEYLSRIFSANKDKDRELIEALHELDANDVLSFLDNYVIINPNFPKDKISIIKSYESKLIHFDKVIKGRAIGKVYPPRRNQMFCSMWDENEKTFIDMIKNNIKKTVIFSQFYPVIMHIKQRLIDNGIKTVTINGSVSTSGRVEALNQFKNNEEVRVIIATSQSMGTGVTLTEASQMFFFGPPWRSADYDQCCDRIYRIGQDVDVFI